MGPDCSESALSCGTSVFGGPLADRNGRGEYTPLSVSFRCNRTVLNPHFSCGAGVFGGPLADKPGGVRALARIAERQEGARSRARKVVSRSQVPEKKQ